MVHHLTVATNGRPATTYLGLVLCATIAGAAGATDFRVHTTVAAEGETQPLSSNLTIFLGPVVYDFTLGGSREATRCSTASANGNATWRGRNSFESSTQSSRGRS